MHGDFLLCVGALQAVQTLRDAGERGSFTRLSRLESAPWTEENSKRDVTTSAKRLNFAIFTILSCKTPLAENATKLRCGL